MEGGYALMHDERRPSSGMGRKYYDNYCLLEGRIMIFIFCGQAPHSQLSRAEYLVLCSNKVVNKGTDSPTVMDNLIVNFIIRETGSEKHFDQTSIGQGQLVKLNKVWSKCFSPFVSRIMKFTIIDLIVVCLLWPTLLHSHFCCSDMYIERSGRGRKILAVFRPPTCCASTQTIRVLDWRSGILVIRVLVKKSIPQPM